MKNITRQLDLYKNGLSNVAYIMSELRLGRFKAPIDISPRLDDSHTIHITLWARSRPQCRAIARRLNSSKHFTLYVKGQWVSKNWKTCITLMYCHRKKGGDN